MNRDCKTCRHQYQTYHCMGCSSYDGDLEEVQSFCGYCNHNKGSDSCNSCVWEDL